MKWLAAGIVPALAFAIPAIAQTAAPNCPADAAPLPPELLAWKAKGSLAAAANAASLATAVLPIGKAVDLTLSPTPSVRYALPVQKPGAAVSSGGMVGFAVERAGSYRVAVGSASWIDVVHDGVAATSVAHGHGPACTGIAKTVDFKLQPGKYVLQISGSDTAATKLLIAPLP